MSYQWRPTSYTGPDRGGRYFGELKGLALKKDPNSESLVGSGLFGGLVCEVEVIAAEGGKKVKVCCPLFALEATDLCVKIGTMYVGEYVYLKKSPDGTVWLNQKTNKALGGADVEEW